MRVDRPVLDRPVPAIPGEAGDPAPLLGLHRRIDHHPPRTAHRELAEEQPAEELQPSEILHQNADLVDRLTTAIRDGELVVLPPCR